MNVQKKVVVGISGGVDSAVSACLLVEQGYAVTGLNIRVLDSLDESPSLKPSPLVISDHPDFQIPVFSLNLSSKFRDDVIHYFHTDYLGGRTPNPCMVCNKKIKWFGLFEGLKLLDADFIATGHFAATSFCNGRYRLYKGADQEKDQSYFLWMLSQSDLAKTLFPLGKLTKPEVRKLAHSFGVRAAEKKESQERYALFRRTITAATFPTLSLALLTTLRMEILLTTQARLSANTTAILSTPSASGAGSALQPKSPSMLHRSTLNITVFMWGKNPHWSALDSSLPDLT